MKTIYESEYDEIEALLIGHSIVSAKNDVLTLDDGKQLLVVGNYGCGGCSSGVYQVDFVADCPNVITGVRFDYTGPDEYGEQAYEVYVYAEGIEKAKQIVSVSGSDGNGYYGTGYSIRVTQASMDAGKG